MTAPDTVRSVAAEAALTVSGVTHLQPGLAHRLAGAASRTWPDTAAALSPPAAGVRVDRPQDASGWHVEVRCVLSEGHRALDVARNVHARVRSAVVSHLAAQGAPDAIAVTVTVTCIAPDGRHLSR
ncbi:Asp23/Gls24 family envelope stress response protein [Actinacidiphila oryziradicis]|uniref:Asp23/Gls24 family envelope stress response protein n=1 Tax=Actinacidiphila oryziradicis TaxID=2571141 RepID=A0A4U0SNK1_9ACTN|nr:Asp23/Gls24 family envelope stress response protein [Actinacidiphila oryziradicis]TKA01935.1 Asp23/Gls24 family envelope stress response protein [Actinacidiphila oryziradicis]